MHRTAPPVQQFSGLALMHPKLLVSGSAQNFYFGASLVVMTYHERKKLCFSRITLVNGNAVILQ